MKLLTEIKRQPAANCAILTFNVDLLFFEQMVFEPLYGAGCRNTLVLCDPGQYTAALDDIEQLHYAGQRYLLLPARTCQGVFHPKLILLTSPEGGRLFLTSGNLTKAGYAHNWEVVTRFECSAKSADAVGWLACRWAIEVLSQIAQASDPSGLVGQRVEQIRSTTKWLRQEPPPDPEVPVWLLHNLEVPLLDQVLARYRTTDASLVTEAIMVSPFFDPQAIAIAQFLDACHPKRVDVYTQENTHGLAPGEMAKVMQRYDGQVRLYHLDLGKRRLHGKVLMFRTQQGVWLATGSANLSRPAWLHKAAAGNTEMIVLRFADQPMYFDAWIQELVAHARPLALDTATEVAEPITAGPVGPKLSLLSAVLQGSYLHVSVSQEIAEGTILSLEFSGEDSWIVEPENWQPVASNVLRFRLAADSLVKLDGPTRLQMRALLPEGEQLSNPVLLLNLSALERYSRPVDRRDRPHIPEGLVPESYEHAAQLLDMLHDLLAMNTEQLDRHGGRIASKTRTEEEEKRLTIEETGDYVPEDHFIQERVATAGISRGGDLYEDFDERLTYEGLLRAAMAAVYHRTPAGMDEPKPQDNGKGGASPSGPDIPPTPPAPPPVPPAATVRIERGFRRLVDNFVQGTADTDYMRRIPPQYLIELFVILSTYLRVVWRDRILDKKAFVDLSLALQSAFWGDPRRPGAWDRLTQRVNKEEEEERVALGAQTWLHAYAMALLLQQDADRRLYDLANWMRSADIVPEVLLALPEEVYRRLWQGSFPSDFEFKSGAEIISSLHEMSKLYDENSLLEEISGWPGTRASLDFTSTAGLTKIPQLNVARAHAAPEVSESVKK